VTTRLIDQSERADLAVVMVDDIGTGEGMTQQTFGGNQTWLDFDADPMS
jgi:hypothetical protein